MLSVFINLNCVCDQDYMLGWYQDFILAVSEGKINTLFKCVVAATWQVLPSQEVLVNSGRTREAKMKPAHLAQCRSTRIPV